MLNSSASGGRDVLAGYDLESLGQRWKVNQPAGVSFEGIKPCGPHLVCVKTRTQNGEYHVAAVEVGSGKVTWEKTAPFDADPWWYVLGGKLIYGPDWFGSIRNTQVLDPASGNASHAFGDQRNTVYTEAGDGGRLVLVASSSSFTGGSVTINWQVAVGDHGSGKG